MIKLVQLETCESTNDEAWKQLPSTSLVVTRAQTRGRGRQGRKWEGDPKNVMASYVFEPSAAHVPNLLWLPLAAGVATFEAIQLTTPTEDLEGLRLKWPNDIMWENAKMGGLLCESRTSGEKVSGVVIGLGLNLVSHPTLADMKATHLAEHVEELGDARDRFLGFWVDRLQYWTDALAQNQTDSLRKRWLEFAKLSAFSQVTVHDRNGALLKLKALDLDPSGKLKASLDSKIVYLDQADSI